MDRKTITALLVITATIIFFSSETWRKIVRGVFGLPEPPKVERMAGDSVVPVKETRKDTATPRMSESVAPATGDTGAGLTDSVAKASVDSLAGLAKRRVVVKTPDYVAVVGGAGGRIEAIQLLGVSTREGAHPWILPKGRGGALAVKVADDDLADEPFAIEGIRGDSVELKGNDSATLRLTWRKGGRSFERTYVFRASRPSVGMAFQAKGWDDPAVRLRWDAGIRQIDAAGPKIPFGPPHFNNVVWKDADEVTSHTDRKPVSATGPLAWVGLRSQYAMSAVLFEGDLREGDLDVDTLGAIDSTGEQSFKWSFRWRPADGGDRMELAITPLEVNSLKAWKAGFEQMLFSGYAWFFRADIWFPHLCLFVLWLLGWFHSLLPNYGIAIILLTFVARFAVLPLTLKQVRQSKRMAEVMPLIKPKLEAIKEKHKNDPRKVQEETMRVYAEYGINPLASLAGCLPLLLQMPIFISLYMVLGRAIELRGAPFALWITDLARPDVVTEIVKVPLLFPLGITILPIAMAASLWGLNKLTIKDPQQQMLVWVMPIMMLLFSGTMPSGLVLYWTVSNLFSMAQTWLINAGPMPEAPKVHKHGGVEVKADRSKKKKS